MLPRTANQRLFVSLLQVPKPPIVFASGPAGTGKTLVACHVGAEALAGSKPRRRNRNGSIEPTSVLIPMITAYPTDIPARVMP